MKILLVTLLAVPMLATAAPPQGATRAEVKESLHLARISGRMSNGGEIADPPEVLKAREEFNALQAEVLTAERRAERERLAERD